MRELIRPTLFIIARTGLFLAVMAWIISQWAMYGLDCSVLCIRLIDDGWEVGILELTQPMFLGRIQPLIQEPTPRLGPPISFSVNYGMAMWYFFIRHWLITTVFLTFNIAVHFIYRKRPEVQPCES